MLQRQSVADSCYPSLPSPTLAFLRSLNTLPVGSLLCPITADCHAAPPASMTARSIEEQQRAGLPLASLHVAEILLAYEVGQCSRYWQEQ
jgi:hypothetical protein